MPVNTVLSVLQGNTTLLFVTGKLPPALRIGEDEGASTRHPKLASLDALYDAWVASTEEPKKSVYFRYGRRHGFTDGYVGSLFFIDEDVTSPELMLIHIFEDFVTETYDPLGSTLRKGPKTYGAEAARAYQNAFSAQGGFAEHLAGLGITDLKVWHMRYKNGHTYP